MSTNSPLADLVLPYFRTNSRNLWQWSAANAHGESMFNGLGIIESAIAELNNSPRPTYSGAQIFDVIHRALNSSMRVLLRADDSSGIIGEAIQALLNLHARMAVFLQRRRKSSPPGSSSSTTGTPAAFSSSIQSSIGSLWARRGWLSCASGLANSGTRLSRLASKDLHTVSFQLSTS
ncbi:hypothetical protein [Trueperella pyogenes]|uniref:hypothetical protein n=1 Tax=Trueperella pyogenes TaxID=1661 RepID=UPI00345D0C51